MFDYVGDSLLKEIEYQNSRTMSLKSKIYIFREIAQALRFLSDRQIIHLDLKPENFFFRKDYRLLVFDFSESYHK